MNKGNHVNKIRNKKKSHSTPSVGAKRRYIHSVVFENRYRVVHFWRFRPRPLFAKILSLAYLLFSLSILCVDCREIVGLLQSRFVWNCEISMVRTIRINIAGFLRNFSVPKTRLRLCSNFEYQNKGTLLARRLLNVFDNLLAISDRKRNELKSRNNNSSYYSILRSAVCKWRQSHDILWIWLSSPSSKQEKL